MDIEKYISSGILEAYALGELTPAERAEVEKMVSRYPQIKAELAQVEETMEAIAFHSAVAPKEELKRKVLDKAFGEENSLAAGQEDGEQKLIPLQPKGEDQPGKRPKFYSYSLAAAISLTVISSFAAFYFFSKWQDAEDRLYVVVAERTALARQFKTVENQLEDANRALAIYTSEDFNEVELEGLALAPEAGATIFWNKSTQEVFLNPSNLPSTPADKQYQLWAIVDGQPVDLGVVPDNKNSGLLKMQEIENAAAFAITLEPAGGSSSPTLEQMYVLGKTS